LSEFHFPGIFPNEVSKVAMMKARLIDRVFSVEYLDFENKQINEFYNVRRINSKVEISGFVSWLNKGRFLLLASKTTQCMFMHCKVGEGLERPPDNQYITCKGTIHADIGVNGSPYFVLIIDEYFQTNPDFGKVESDISPKDFQGYVFENWTGIDEITQNYLIQSLVSSPSSTVRCGGLTQSLFSFPKTRILVKRLDEDLLRSIAPEILGKKAALFEIPELATKHRLPIPDWKLYSSNLENISQLNSERLDRIPGKTNQEYSMSLLANQPTPRSLDEEGLVKSDYPLLLQDQIERKRSPYYTDLKISKYILATHFNNPIINTKDYEKGVSFVQSEIRQVVEDEEFLENEILGYKRFLDIGINGKPLSVINLGLSSGRTVGNMQVSFENIQSSTDDFILNLENLFAIWRDELHYGTIDPLSSLSHDERKIITFILKNGPQTISELNINLEFSTFQCMRIIQSLLNKAVLYMSSDDKYDTTLR